MTDENNPAQVVATAPDDEVFPELKTLTYKEMYDVVGKFLQKAIPMKGDPLKIVKGTINRVSPPEPPYIILQVKEEKKLSTSETR